MAKRSSLALVACLMVTSLLGQAQRREATPHAFDGGASEMISSIYIPPMPNAPFQATITLEWTKHLPDGSMTVVKNHRLVVRDSQGRIYQERRMLVPQGSSQEPEVRSIEISNPVTHTKYFAIQRSRRVSSATTMNRSQRRLRSRREQSPMVPII